MPVTILAQTERDINPPPEVKITTARTKAVIGEVLVWHLEFNLQPGQHIDDLDLQPGDAQTWRWVNVFTHLTGFRKVLLSLYQRFR